MPEAETLSEYEQKHVERLQRILDAQGYLIICRDRRGGVPALHEIICDDWGDTLNVLNGMQGSALMITGFATCEQMLEQNEKYYPERASQPGYREACLRNRDRFYYVKVGAE